MRPTGPAHGQRRDTWVLYGEFDRIERAVIRHMLDQSLRLEVAKIFHCSNTTLSRINFNECEDNLDEDLLFLQRWDPKVADIDSLALNDFWESVSRRIAAYKRRKRLSWNHADWEEDISSSEGSEYLPDDVDIQDDSGADDDDDSDDDVEDDSGDESCAAADRRVSARVRRQAAPYVRTSVSPDVILRQARARSRQNATSQDDISQAQAGDGNAPHTQGRVPQDDAPSPARTPGSPTATTVVYQRKAKSTANPLGVDSGNGARESAESRRSLPGSGARPNAPPGVNHRSPPVSQPTPPLHLRTSVAADERPTAQLGTVPVGAANGMDNALPASAPPESARKRPRRVITLLRSATKRSPDPRPTVVLSQSLKPKASPSATAKRPPEKVPSPSAPNGSPSRLPASQLPPKHPPPRQPQPVSNGSRSTERKPPSSAQSSSPHPQPSDSSAETPAGQRMPQSPPEDVVLNPKKRVRDTAADSLGKGSACSEEHPQQAPKRVKLERDDSPRAQGSVSSKEPHSSVKGRAGRGDSLAHVFADNPSRLPDAEGARTSLPVGLNERPSLEGVSHIDEESRQTSNDVTAAQAVIPSCASSAVVDARRNTNSTDGTNQPSPRTGASTSEAVPRASLSRTERQGSCRPDSGSKSANPDNTAVGTPLSNGQNQAIRTAPSQANVATQTERPDQIVPAEQQHATLQGIDPDITRYVEALGLPPDIYASKLEAIGLKNGAIINATRNLISEDRKDKLEQELQRLCGLSVVESMVLISGLRQVRTT